MRTRYSVQDIWFLTIGYDILQTGFSISGFPFSRQKHGRYIYRVVWFGALIGTLLGVLEAPWMLVLLDLHF